MSIVNYRKAPTIWPLPELLYYQVDLCQFWPRHENNDCIAASNRNPSFIS